MNRNRRGAFELGDKLYVYGELTELEKKKLDDGFDVVKPTMGTYACKYPENNCLYSDV